MNNLVESKYILVNSEGVRYFKKSRFRPVILLTIIVFLCHYHGSGHYVARHGCRGNLRVKADPREGQYCRNLNRNYGATCGNLIESPSDVSVIPALLKIGLYINSMSEQFYVYIMTNSHHTVLYTGITSCLKRRVYEHKNKMIKGFTSRYNFNKLVYFEIFSNSYHAILWEKQINAGSQRKKILLIESVNLE